jgi:hypothetical protein
MPWVFTEKAKQGYSLGKSWSYLEKSVKFTKKESVVLLQKQRTGFATQATVLVCYFSQMYLITESVIS